MHIQFAEIPLVHQARARKFYTAHFDCRFMADQPMGHDGWQWVELKCPGAETALHFVRRKEDAPAYTPVLGLVEEDTEASVRTLKSQGVKIITEPHRDPWLSGRIIAEFRDSEANRMMISSK